MTLFLVLFVIVLEVVLLVVRRRWPRAHVSLRVASLFCWAGVAAWLHFAFLQSWVVMSSVG